MLSDMLNDAVGQIEDYEKRCPEAYATRTEEIRKLKVEMMMLQLWFDMAPTVADKCTATDFDWLKTEALKRGAERPPYEFRAVFDECMHDFWKKKAGVQRAEVPRRA
jgi:hypothetical protein